MLWNPTIRLYSIGQGLELLVERGREWVRALTKDIQDREKEIERERERVSESKLYKFEFNGMCKN